MGAFSSWCHGSTLQPWPPIPISSLTLTANVGGAREAKFALTANGIFIDYNILPEKMQNGWDNEVLMIEEHAHIFTQRMNTKHLMPYHH